MESVMSEQDEFLMSTGGTAEASASEQVPAEPVSVSGELHQALLPTDAPTIAGYEVAAGTALVEGDEGVSIWTSFTLSDGSSGIAVMHAQGHTRLPAHRLGVARALLVGLGRRTDDLGTLLRDTNEALVQSAAHGFASPLTCAVLVVGPDFVDWASAGVVPGSIIRREGTVEDLGTFGPPLGMLGGFAYGSRPLSLGAGDTVLALSKASVGLLRGAADVVASLHGKPAGEVVSSLHNAIEKAQGDNREEVTALLLRKH